MAEIQSTKEDLLFANCVFAFPLKADIEAGRDSKGRDLRHTLEEHGGKVQPIKSNGLLNLKEVTHIISSTTDFPQYDTARLQMIAVVRSDWVIQSLMKSRMVQTRPFTPDARLFFSGVNLSCGDIPPGDKEAIIGAVLAMGGMETSNITKLTTHICALSMDHPKCQSVKDKNLKCKIVLPHWFDDCLKLGKAIDSAPYELPNPEIFEKKPEDALPFPMSPNVEGATTPHPDENSLMVPTIPSTRQLSVFKSKTVKISEDLELTDRHVRVLGELIKSGGGTTTNSVHEADMYICKYRDGREYVFASRAQIDVGNLSWLYFLIANNQWTSPLRRLLHYPIPRNGIPGFQDLRITLSNYGGEARTYVENLVIAAGGEFTKSMKQDNTHLITARNNSEKCTAAEEWDIAIINHLWIEESYAKCELQALTVPRYTHFPPRTNLGEIIGQTQFDADVLESIYYPKNPTPAPDDPKTLRAPRKNNTVVSITLDGQGDQDDETMADAGGLSPPPKKAARTPAPRRKSKGPLAETHSSTTTPSSHRRASLGKENDTPSSTRSAKASALNRLHDLKDDVALYELERKRTGKGVWGGKRAANQIEKEKTVKATQQRSSSPAEMDVDDESEEEAPAMKRVKTGRGIPKSLPEIQIRVLLTGYKRWLENIKKEEVEKKKLRQLGIHVVSDPLNCTHLAAPAVVRTKKFLCALATGPTIVTSDFVDKCIDDGEIPPVEEFLLRDSEHEKKTKMKLKDILTRAKANRRHLLHNIPVYCTEHVGKELPETYQAIVKVNGGIFSIFRGRGGMKLKPTKPEEDSNPGPDPVYLISGLKPIERQLWPKFEEMANAAHMDPRIVTADWLLDAAISQQLTWDEKYRLMG